jgi:hypothetical protein
MNAIVPDTMQGALIVSIIDFFLSFLIISGIGVVLALFPLLNRVALARERPAAEPASERKAVSAPVSAAVPAASHGDDIAAIAAAVYVVMEGAPHRIINISAAQERASWATAGRIAHHDSHRPHG